MLLPIYLFLISLSIPAVPVIQGEIQPLFLRHEGYLGAVGAFLKAVEEEGRCFSGRAY